jgi:hypothetical protein
MDSERWGRNAFSKASHVTSLQHKEMTRNTSARFGKDSAGRASRAKDEASLSIGFDESDEEAESIS